ncbi:hypothetical protein WUBG_14701 [Wuchereria bancrofti]|uniref:Uncharacterized protein n=1 Tax=Wuchereria bancrofti TaxID=6293 RepID=J9AJL0_WUCBA|nr:hypothetical protein WUBG_14701 [Wuchereria bancrofti]
MQLCDFFSTVSNLLRHEKSSTWNLTSKSLIIIRSVLLLQRSELYLKILLLKKCETNVSDIRLQLDSPKSTATLQQIDLKQILCPAIKHIESDSCPWDWAPGCAWSSFIATAKLDFVPNHILVSLQIFLHDVDLQRKIFQLLLSDRKQNILTDDSSGEFSTLLIIERGC